MEIEATILLRLIDNHVLPACFRYQSELAGSLQTLKMTTDDLGIEGLDTSLEKQTTYLKDFSFKIGELLEARAVLKQKLHQAESAGSPKAEANYYDQEVKPLMEIVRKHSDSLEALIDAELWTLPTYHQLLFLMK